MRIQFILKRNENYGFSSYTRRSSGLWNSTRFIHEAMGARGIHSDIVEVTDNNDIDREITRFKPDVVIIEALWVVPDKLKQLSDLHPDVQWFVHLHSHMPFLALEGIAIEWLYGYAKLGIGLIANSRESHNALRIIFGKKELIFLPNVYLPELSDVKAYDSDKGAIDVGCFGAVRPLKNHLLQALAAIQFAREEKFFLRFHVNGTRLETGGDPVLKNLVKLFELTAHTELVLLPWLEPEDFRAYLKANIDISMQVSLSETFNVVTADAVSAGVPVVVSKEISWTSFLSRAQDNDVKSVVETMHRNHNAFWLTNWNQRLLSDFSDNAQKSWYQFFASL